jgi:hypothetical protein
MKILTGAALTLLAACAATPEKLDSVAQRESAKMPAPSKRFASFASYELKPVAFGPAVEKDNAKIERAKELGAALAQKLEPLLTEWRAAPSGAGRSGRLVIEPQLAGLRIVSGGARFWAGAMAGRMAGGWSVGKSDSNLLDYITAVSYQYLKDHYWRARGDPRGITRSRTRRWSR